MSFCFYAAPVTVVGDETSAARRVEVGLGSDDTGAETAFVGLDENYDNCSINLTLNELSDLIDVLMETLGVMDIGRSE
jgi:hypothetical protein